MDIKEAEEARKFLNKNLSFAIEYPKYPNRKHRLRIEVEPTAEDKEKIETDLIHGGTQWALMLRFKNLTREEIGDIASQWFKTKLYNIMRESGLRKKDFG